MSRARSLSLTAKLAILNARCSTPAKNAANAASLSSRYPPVGTYLTGLTSRAPIEAGVDRSATAIEPIVNPPAATIKVLVEAIASRFR